MFSKESIVFIFAIILYVISLIILLSRSLVKFYTHTSSFKKIIFDFSDKSSLYPYKKTEKEEILHINFNKNLFTDFFIHRYLIFNNKIYITNNFKNKFNLYDIKNPSFEKIVLNNLNAILNSMTININSTVICSLQNDNKIYKVLESIIPFSEKIYISTSDENFYKKINCYCLEKYGLGLLKKNIEQTENSDLIIILNERKCDFYKKGRYVISLMENHPVFNCNILWDFYERNNEFLNDIPIKKAYFIEDNAKKLKLQWKIMKKS